MTGLEDRNWEKLQEKDYFALDYADVREKIKQEKEKSLSFLEKALNSIEICGGGHK